MLLSGSPLSLGGIMANSGTYLKSTDITNGLALDFLNADSSDLGVYFDYADSCVVAMAKRCNITDVSQIALDVGGGLVDVNLKQYALLKFYIRLFSDNRRRQDTTDTGNLSDNVSYDKYVSEIKDLNSEIGQVVRDISYYTITDTVYTADNMINVVELRRA